MKKAIFICTFAVCITYGVAILPVETDAPVQIVEAVPKTTKPAETTQRPAPEPTPKVKKIELKKLRQKKIKPKSMVKESDIFRLAQLMYSENGSAKDDECVLLTGIVVMKRVKSKFYPDTIKGVISQKGQYATYMTGGINCSPDERCMEIAEEILRNGLADDYPDNLVFQAEFAQGRSVFKKFGHEYFCLA